jgi:hypothetical protein
VSKWRVYKAAANLKRANSARSHCSSVTPSNIGLPSFTQDCSNARSEKSRDLTSLLRTLLLITAGAGRDQIYAQRSLVLFVQQPYQPHEPHGFRFPYLFAAMGIKGESSFSGLYAGSDLSQDCTMSLPMRRLTPSRLVKSRITLVGRLQL